jgi:hypothetical protein
LLLEMQLPPHGPAAEAMPLRTETLSVTSFLWETPKKMPLKQL